MGPCSHLSDRELSLSSLSGSCYVQETEIDRPAGNHNALIQVSYNGISVSYSGYIHVEENRLSGIITCSTSKECCTLPVGFVFIVVSVNSMTLERCGSMFFKLWYQTHVTNYVRDYFVWNCFHVNTKEHREHDESTLVQVTVWCRQTTSQ